MVLSLVSGSLPWQDASAQQDTARIAGYGLSNPAADDASVMTWDCIYFGNYWQNDTNGDGVADKNDEKYATITARGVVTTKKAGKGKTITITAKATDGSGKKDTLKIKIK